MKGPDLRSDGSSSVWRALLAAGETGLPSSQLVDQTGLTRQAVHKILDELAKSGFIRSTGHQAAQRWIVLPHGAPRSGPAEYRLWQTARGFGTFSPTDLAAYASVGDEGGAVTVKEAQSFCRMLHDAGYLKVKVKAKPGIREARYQLIRNTGPKPPMKRRVTVLFDPNTGEVQVPEMLS